jgi:hypothetical protein
MPITNIAHRDDNIVLCNYEGNIYNAIIELLTHLNIPNDGYLNNMILIQNGTVVVDNQTLTTYALYNHDNYVFNIASDHHCLVLYL